MKRSRGLLLATVATTAALAGVVAVGAGTTGHRTTGTGTGKDRLPPATTEITRTDLVRSKNVDGQLDFAGRRTVKAAVEGTVTVAAKPGSTVSAGQELYRLDDRPVTLLYGQVPMYRDLKTGDSGSDVLQLERNLRDLGFGAGLHIDVHFDQATEAAVKRWQKSLNRETTGTVGRGDVVFQPERLKVVTADAALADRVGPDKAILTVASVRPVVRARLDQGDAPLTAPDTRVEVTLADGTTLPGKVSGTVRPETAEPSAPGRNGDGITVEITLDGSPSTSEGGPATATATVKFVSEAHRDVLTVPVEAVVALRGENGGYGLQVVQGDTVRTVRVTTGMTADGRIEVQGEELRAGMKVGVAKQ
ncbi:peptidoglycan-binding protein [Kitasatospora sp. NPDC057542]|uniref:peptidoglycan-binding protein n=1 Tax=Streptomycetaceae TaxID=2062 RepID=UPI001CCDE1A5|nr:peptidoglycan-binding protein [Streptomyces sp. LS1784]